MVFSFLKRDVFLSFGNGDQSWQGFLAKAWGLRLEARHGGSST